MCKAQSSGKATRMADENCKHERTRLIAKDDNSEYVECLECGKILDREEMKKKEESEFSESVADA